MYKKKRNRTPSFSSVNSPLIRKSMQKVGLIFLLPTCAAFCVGFLYPFFKGLYLSFCNFTTTSDGKWVGLSNYVQAVQDPSFVHAFWYTALFAAVTLILINVFAFLVAYALTRGIKGANLFRTVFFMPNLIGGIVLGYIWSMIFGTLLPALFHTTLALSTQCGFWGLVILICWQQIGYMMIIYIAGIQNIPTDIEESARMDGANGWQMLRHITIPSVMPSITICTFLTLTNSFKLFDQNLALNGGQPFIFKDGTTIRTTEMLALNIYNTFYGSANSRGVGQAKAVLFFLLVGAIGLLQLRSTKSKEVQR